LEILRVKAMLLFDVPSVGEHFAIGGLQLVGTGRSTSAMMKGPLPGRGELVMILVALDEP
jgi:hypothetical protein